MAGSGQSILDLGAFPGVADAEFTVTGLAGIADASQVEAWIEPADTTDHSLDEHIVDGPKVIAYSPSAAGSSMKIRLSERDSIPVTDWGGGPVVNGNSPLVWGKWNVGWAWA